MKKEKYTNSILLLIIAVFSISYGIYYIYSKQDYTFGITIIGINILSIIMAVISILKIYKINKKIK